MTTPFAVSCVSGALGFGVGTALKVGLHAGPRPRLLFVAGGTGLLFAAVTWRFGISAELPAYLYLATIGVTLTVLDVDVRRLPDVIVLPSYIVSVLLLMPAGAANAGWWNAERAMAGMAALLVLFFALALAYPNGLGMSDVKLAGLVGMYLGWLSWNALFLTAVGSILIAAVVGTVAIVTKHANRNVAVPFGPCLIGAAVLALFVSTPISSWYSSLITA